MESIFSSNLGDEGNVKKILEKKIPSYRQAYSDRTAWFMACLSDLAYIKFNAACDDNGKELEHLKSELERLSFKLVQTFDEDGTQAILVRSEEFVVLAFRGTEMTSPKDIETDFKINQILSGTKGRVHQGFKEAFEAISSKVMIFLKKDEYLKMPLFLTGHSLGGALATVATKNIKHEGGLAACYTFGSPKVGDEEWAEGIKTPIYRLVNALDIVTMIPPGRGVAWALLCWVTQITPKFGKYIQKKIPPYHHCGDIRYLTVCSKDNYKNVKLLNKTKFWFKVCGYLSKRKKKFLTDHCISIYRKKLVVIAIRRN